jgi:hypothetical protein
VFLGAICCRRVLLRGGCGCSFLISCGRVPINDQSEHAEGMNSLLTFVFSHPVWWSMNALEFYDAAATITVFVIS